MKSYELLVAGSHQESLPVYTDGFRACEPLGEDDTFTHKYVARGDARTLVETVTTLSFD